MDEWYYSGETLGQLQLTWYSHINPDKTVEIVNFLKDHAAAGDTIFYDIYTEAEKAADPAKKDTGLFFFKGEPGEKFAICNAGGGFAYVGAMHDSFPHALELSKKGYNAFALIYRPGAQTACEDLARAVSFVFEHADELQVDTDCYSLWGGSAGARMAAYLGTYGPAVFGGDDLPRPGAVIMQYTGHSEYSEIDPPTYVCVGESDGIANWRTMQSRLQALSDLGIDTEFHEKLIKLVRKYASEKDATSAQISLAWLLAKKPYIVPIPGSRSVERLHENAKAADIHLLPQEVKKIDEALEQMNLLVFDGSVLPDESKQEA